MAKLSFLAASYNAAMASIPLSIIASLIESLISSLISTADSIEQRWWRMIRSIRELTTDSVIMRINNYHRGFLGGNK